MDQQKTGSFIAELRKEANLSQMELAERLGISNKAVSKWETGKGMPDVSIMIDLCSELHITVNELLSGERLDHGAPYNEKAEENMMNLMKEAKEEKAKNHSTIFAAVFGLLAIVLAYLLLILTVGGIGAVGQGIAMILDLPSLLLILIPTALLLVASGTLKSFFQAFPVCYGRGQSPEELDPTVLTSSYNAVRYARSTILLVGALVSLMTLIFLLYRMDDLSTLGPNIAIMLLALLYGTILNILLLPMESRLKGAMNNASPS